MAGRLGVVRCAAWSGEELLGVVRGVEETALTIYEVGQRRVKETACRSEPPWLPGGLVQGEQAFGHVAVVIRDPHRGSDHALARCPAQPAVNQVGVHEKLRAPSGRLHVS